MFSMLQPGTCFVDENCFADQDSHPTHQSCLFCDAEKSNSDWAHRVNSDTDKSFKEYRTLYE